MFKEHPDFIPPADPETRIWRYVDLTRFLSMLTTRSLFFSRADLLGDTFEGTISDATVKSYNDPRSPSSMPAFQAMMKRMREALIRNVVISCWHIAEYESQAMWNMYAARHSGIAIRTTYSRLASSLEAWPMHTFIGRVNYVDYDSMVVGNANMLSPFVHKRREFESEQELRVLVSQLPAVEREGRRILDYSVSMPEGMLAPVDIDVLIESVVLSPKTARWQADAISKTVATLGFSFPTNASALDRKAILG